MPGNITFNQGHLRHDSCTQDPAAELQWKDGWRAPQKSGDVAPNYKYPMYTEPDPLTGVIEPFPLGGVHVMWKIPVRYVRVFASCTLHDDEYTNLHTCKTYQCL